MSTYRYSTIKPANGVPRVSVKRWIFVGDDLNAFANQWLKSFAEMHAYNRIEGYVLDLTRGGLWGALDMSEVSQEVYDDIALLVVEPEDTKASKAFMKLTRNCDPTTAPNQITTAFDPQQWPNLAEACSRLERLGLRDLDSMGKWLKAEAGRLDKTRNRRAAFRSSIKRIVETYPERPTWNKDLALQADKNHWPAWAVECLPSLYLPQAFLPGRGEKTLVWHYILACVPKSYKYEAAAELCDGHVIEADLSEEAAAFIQSIAPTFEQRRIGNLDSSERSTIGVVTHTMSDFQNMARKRLDYETARAFEGAQRKILEQAGIIKKAAESGTSPWESGASERADDTGNPEASLSSTQFAIRAIPNEAAEPDLDVLIGSLEKIAVGLESEQERGPEFHTLVETALKLYPWIHLDQQAGGRNFPAWSIPHLSQPSKLTSDGVQ